MSGVQDLWENKNAVIRGLCPFCYIVTEWNYSMGVFQCKKCGFKANDEHFQPLRVR